MDPVALISKALSVAIVAGSFLLKVPQIIKIIRNKSAEGISLAMLSLELVGYTINILYNLGHGYALENYAENMIIAVENVVAITLVAQYNKQMDAKFAALSTLYAIWLGLAMGGLIPLSATMFLMTFVQIPISAASRIPQIMTNYRNKGTGNLDWVMFLLAWGGCMARIVTTLTSNADPLILLSFSLNAFLNFFILMQFVVYRPKKQD